MKSYYACTYVERSMIGFHRLICKCDDNQQVDHIDHDTLNNCLKNLRAVSCSINSRNRKRSSRNTSGVSGIYFDKKQNRWVARIYSPKGKESKSFAVNKHADALQQAIMWHREKELEYGYISQPPSKDFIFNEHELPLIEHKIDESTSDSK